MNHIDEFQQLLYKGVSLKACFGKTQGQTSFSTHWTGCDDDSSVWNGPEFDRNYDFDKDPLNYSSILREFAQLQKCKFESENNDSSNKTKHEIELDKRYFGHIECIGNEKLGLEHRWFAYCYSQAINFVGDQFVGLAKIYQRKLGINVFTYCTISTSFESISSVFRKCLTDVILSEDIKKRINLQL